jgi:hypothetical protein
VDQRRVWVGFRSVGLYGQFDELRPRIEQRFAEDLAEASTIMR